MNLNKIKLLLCLDICLYIVAVCIVLVYIWKMFNMEFIIKYFCKTLYMKFIIKYFRKTLYMKFIIKHFRKTKLVFKI